MNEQRNNGRGVFYGVIGVATLVVAIIGATFAYFTATQSAGNNVITGNMATISFGVKVEKVVDPGLTSGMIPMSNTMIEDAVYNPDNAICVDDNGNAVCQIYKITVTNTSSAAMFVDGYIALAGGSGTPTDYPSSFYVDGDPEKALSMYVPAAGETPASGVVKNVTTMRWAQVFPKVSTKGDTDHDGVKDEGETWDEATTYNDYSTSGEQKLGIGATEKVNITQIGNKADTTGKNTDNILIDSTGDDGIRGSLSISGSSYVTVAKNFIRLSNHTVTPAAVEGGVPTPVTSFDRTDVTSTLVLSQQLQPAGSKSGAGSNEVQTDIAEYYFMVWLSETGTAQNPKTETSTDNYLASSASNFFNGVVTFNSAQGSEVTATFSGYTAVKSDKAEQTS